MLVRCSLYARESYQQPWGANTIIRLVGKMTNCSQENKTNWILGMRLINDKKLLHFKSQWIPTHRHISVLNCLILILLFRVSSIFLLFFLEIVLQIILQICYSSRFLLFFLEIVFQIILQICCSSRLSCCTLNPHSHSPPCQLLHSSNWSYAIFPCLGVALNSSK